MIFKWRNYLQDDALKSLKIDIVGVLKNSLKAGCDLNA